VASELPDWLTDPQKHMQATTDEIDIYQHIAHLTEQVSDAREQRKAEHLIGLLTAHNQVVAFDSHPMKLLDLQKRIDTIAPPAVRTVVATGEDLSGRKQVTELSRLGSSTTGVIALCSDSMSEGYNLQAASAVVHLDMPTVVRQAEQRVGRVDRMYSPNAIIEAWWPQDSAAFALHTDERFYARVQLVENLIGSNLPLPGDHSSSIVSVEHSIQEYEADEATDAVWEGFGDAFAPVRALVSSEKRLVPELSMSR
jgi:superfamily II DNA/RNA helicase